MFEYHFLYSHKLGAECSWSTPTDTDSMLQCMDGKHCSWNYGAGNGCCNEKGGRAKCPKNKPVMCAKKDCAKQNEKSDYCCETLTDCDQYYGGMRLCKGIS